jgi:hypothetical protein
MKAYIIYRKKTEASLVGNKEICLEVNNNKTKYTVMSRDQNTGRCHNIKICYSPFERVEQFKYLETTLTNQNPNKEEIKSKLQLGNAC